MLAAWVLEWRREPARRKLFRYLHCFAAAPLGKEDVGLVSGALRRLLNWILFMPHLTGRAAVSSPLTARMPGTDIEFRDTSRCILGAVVWPLSPLSESCSRHFYLVNFPGPVASCRLATRYLRGDKWGRGASWCVIQLLFSFLHRILLPRYFKGCLFIRTRIGGDAAIKSKRSWLENF